MVTAGCACAFGNDVCECGLAAHTEVACYSCGRDDIYCKDCRMWCRTHYCPPSPGPSEQAAGPVIYNRALHNRLGWGEGGGAPIMIAPWWKPSAGGVVPVVGDMPNLEITPVEYLDLGQGAGRQSGTLNVSAEFLLRGAAAEFWSERHVSLDMAFRAARPASELQKKIPYKAAPLHDTEVEQGLLNDLSNLTLSSRTMRGFAAFMPQSLATGVPAAAYLSRLHETLLAGDSHVALLVRACSMVLCAMWCEATGGQWPPGLGDDPPTVVNPERDPGAIDPMSRNPAIWIAEADAGSLTFWSAVAAGGAMVAPNLDVGRLVEPIWAFDLSSALRYVIVVDSPITERLPGLAGLSSGMMVSYISAYVSRLNLLKQLELAWVLATALPAVGSQKVALPYPRHPTDLAARLTLDVIPRMLLPFFSGKIAHPTVTITKAVMRAGFMEKALGAWLGRASGAKADYASGKYRVARDEVDAWISSASTTAGGLWGKAVEDQDPYLRQWLHILPWLKPGNAADAALFEFGQQFDWPNVMELVCGVYEPLSPLNEILSPGKVVWTHRLGTHGNMAHREMLKVLAMGLVSGDGKMYKNGELGLQHFQVPVPVTSEIGHKLSPIIDREIWVDFQGLRPAGRQGPERSLLRYFRGLLGATTYPPAPRYHDPRDALNVALAQVGALPEVAGGVVEARGTEVPTALRVPRPVEAGVLLSWFAQHDWDEIPNAGGGMCGPQAILDAARAAGSELGAALQPVALDRTVAMMCEAPTGGPWDSEMMRAAALYLNCSLVLALPEGPVAASYYDDAVKVAVRWRRDHWVGLQTVAAAFAPVMDVGPAPDDNADGGDGDDQDNHDGGPDRGTRPSKKKSSPKRGVTFKGAGRAVVGAWGKIVLTAIIQSSRVTSAERERAYGALRTARHLSSVPAWLHLWVVRATAVGVPIKTMLGNKQQEMGVLIGQLTEAAKNDTSHTECWREILRSLDEIAAAHADITAQCQELPRPEQCCHSSPYGQAHVQCAALLSQWAKGQCLAPTADSDFKAVYPIAAIGSGVRLKITLRAALACVRAELDPEAIRLLVSILKQLYGAAMQTAVAYVLWFVSVPPALRLSVCAHVLDWGCANCVPLWAKYTSDIARLTGMVGNQQVPVEQVPAFAYMHCLAPKAHGEVDWAKEMSLRTSEAQHLRAPKGYVSAEAFIKDYLTRYMRKCGYVSLTGIRTLKDSWERRAGRHVAGAAGMKPPPETAAAWKEVCSLLGVSGSITKQQIVETLGNEYLSQAVKAKPCCYSVGHTKRNEMAGKLRPIYGTDFRHYAISDYVSAAFDGVLKSPEFGIGVDPQSAGARLVKLHETAAKRPWLLSFDYKDFNERHTLEAMAAVYAAMGDVVSTGMRDSQEKRDMLSAIRWLEESMFEIRIRGPSTAWYHAKFGLLSGFRHTTLLNTLLNLAYDALVRAWAEEDGSPVSEPLFACYHGDDVLMGWNARHECVNWRDTAIKGGLEANPAKCLVRLGAGEFLRMWITPGGVAGQQNRAIGSFVSGNYDQEGIPRGHHALSLREQTGVLAMRGMPPTVALLLAVETISFFDPRAEGSYAGAGRLLTDKDVMGGEPLPPDSVASAVKALQRELQQGKKAEIAVGRLASEQSDVAVSRLKTDIRTVIGEVRRRIARRQLPVRATAEAVMQAAKMLWPRTVAEHAGQMAGATRTLGARVWSRPLAGDAATEEIATSMHTQTGTAGRCQLIPPQPGGTHSWVAVRAPFGENAEWQRPVKPVVAAAGVATEICGEALLLLAGEKSGTPKAAQLLRSFGLGGGEPEVMDTLPRYEASRHGWLESRLCSRYYPVAQPMHRNNAQLHLAVCV